MVLFKFIAVASAVYLCSQIGTKTLLLSDTIGQTGPITLLYGAEKGIAAAVKQ